MPAYRYKHLALDYTALRNAVPGLITPGGTGGPIFVDVNAPATSKADLDDYMTTIGWAFIGTNLVSTPLLDSRCFPHASIDVSAGGIIIVTPVQAQREFVILTGVLLANVILEFPAVDGADWVIKNSATLGAFNVSIRAAGQAAAPIVQGNGTMTVWCDGTSVGQMTSLVP